MIGDTSSTGAHPGDTQPRITVTGRGIASVVPDVARVAVGIQTEAPTAREASTRCAEAMRRVIDALHAQGIAARDIQSAHLSLAPRQQSAPDGTWQRVGYTATNTVLLKLSAIDRAGAVVDAVIDAGGDDVTIQGMRLTATDTTAAHTEARHAALADARAQAEDIATTMSLRLGLPLSIQTMATSDVHFRAASKGPFLAHSVAPPVEAGEIEVSVEVEVVFSAEVVTGA